MSKNCLNVLERDDCLKKLANEPVDLLVIGGGITGAGIALDAASRGIKVALVEKADFSSGTSSRSTKLIHGGLRYLKQLELSVVRETGKERAIAYRNAPYLVHPEKLILPIQKKGSLGWYSTSFALWVYDFLAGVSKSDRKKMISKSEMLKLLPQFKSKDLIGAGLYSEYRSDDSRLTIEIIKKAVSYGALAFNYLEGLDFIYQEKLVSGIVAKDHIRKQEIKISAKCVVNAAGPWVDEIRKTKASIGKKRLVLSKGVHLVINKEKLHLSHAVYFEAKDKRMIFAIPREGKIYFGTTDTVYTDNINTPKTSKKDALYLLECMNDAFEGINLQLSDVVSSWAGLRPLIHEDGKSSSEISRKDEIFISSNGLFSIAGGKLTAYRSMAKRVVDLVNKKMNFSNKECQTSSIILSKSKIDINDIKTTKNKLFKVYKTPVNELKYLWSRYGMESKKILDKKPVNSNPKVALIINEFDYCLEHESLWSLLDFFRLRNARVYFYPESMNELIAPIAEHAKQKLKWTEEKKQKEIDTLNVFLKEAITFE